MTTQTQTNGHGRTTKRGATATTLVIKPAAVVEAPEEIALRAIATQTMEVTIEGKSQLIVNNFGAKSLQQMEDLRSLTKEEKMKQRKEGRAAVTPEEIERRFQAARCLDSEGRDCIRAAWVKGALITASKYPDIGIQSTKLRGAVYVEGDFLPIQFVPRGPRQSDERVTYYGKGPGMAKDIVRVQSGQKKVPDIRYRPVYDDWSITFRITFEPALISLAELYHLVRRAGMSVGLCEWRPEGPGGKGGQYGRFDLQMSGVRK